MKKVVICAQCGSKMRAGIKFCTKCGYGLRDEQAEALAAAALAEEISANQFTEEELAALEAAAAEVAVEEPEAVVEEVVAEAAPEAVVEEAVVEEAIAEPLPLTKKQKKIDRENDKVRRELAEKEVDRAKIGESIQLAAQSYDSRIADMQQEADIVLSKKKEKEGEKVEKIKVARRLSNYRKLARKERSQTMALLSEGERAEKYKQKEKKNEVRAKVHENRLLAKEVEVSKKLQKEQAKTEAKLQSMRHKNELKTEKNAASSKKAHYRKLSKQEFNHNKALIAEAERTDKFKQKEKKNEVRAKVHENRLLSNEVVTSTKLQKEQAKSEVELQAIRHKNELKAEKTAAANKKAHNRKIAKQERTRNIALLNEEHRFDKSKQREADNALAAKEHENRLLEEDVRAAKKLQKKNAEAELKLQGIRHKSDLGAARKVASEKADATKKLAAEEAKASLQQNDELKKSVQERTFENRLYAKKTKADLKLQKHRQADIVKAADATAYMTAKENKKLGYAEIRSAKETLSPEAVASRRQAEAVELNFQKQRLDEKRTLRGVGVEKKLIRQRSADMDKNANIAASLRAKETKLLGKAERKSLQIGLTEEILETRRQADEIRLKTDERYYEDKLYAKKIAAEKRLIKVKAADAEKIQNEGIKDKKLLQSAQMMEDSRNARVKSEETKRLLRHQKSEDELLRRRTSLDQRMSAREDRLELKKQNAINAHEEKVMAAKEKELVLNKKLAKAYEDEQIKRAKRIGKISGVPVSLVPALTGEASPMMLQTGGGLMEGNAASLQNPEVLLSNSYEDNRAQYLAYKRRKKEEKERLRFVEIGIRNDKKYYSTIYRNGEVLVPKRNVRISRIQGLIAIVLMIVMLVGAMLPMYRAPEDALNILNGSDSNFYFSFESVLGSSSSFSEDSDPIGYVTTALNAVMANPAGGIGEFVAGLTGLLGQEGAPGIGVAVVVLLLAVAIVLNPIIILFNLFIAAIRFIFYMLRRRESVGITKIMKNLRASYSMLGFILLPMLVMEGYELALGGTIMLATFGVSILFNMLLNLIKVHEKGDRKYARAVRISALVRLLLLVVAFVLLKMGNAICFVPNMADFTGYLALAFIALFTVFYGFSLRSVTTLGFEIIGYTRGKSTSHLTMSIAGIVASVFAFITLFLLPLSAGVTTSSIVGIAGALGCFAGTLLFTGIFALVKRIIAARYSLIEPILNALGEGYPIK